MEILADSTERSMFKSMNLKEFLLRQHQFKGLKDRRILLKYFERLGTERRCINLWFAKRRTQMKELQAKMRNKQQFSSMINNPCFIHQKPSSSRIQQPAILSFQLNNVCIDKGFAWNNDRFQG
ncbi:hypothetical protein WR25_19603 [Diploscapter pachys]|uniref:Homeobox domain-containing protein n=1 Tax=Diploscapter pachys TaxID=2018661 RepID=A0A2A2KU64_9BILA|nr:hypothetical protein WR25_19603 [Diploscapter pachys]